MTEWEAAQVALKKDQIEHTKARIIELTERIEKSPGWGAAVGEMHRERRMLEANLNWLLCDLQRASA